MKRTRTEDVAQRTNDQPDADVPGAAITLEELSFTYPDGTDAVRNVSLTIPEGECFGFLGPNGAGKTTAIRPS